MRIGVIGSGTASKTLPAHFAALASAEVEPAIVNPRLSAFAFTPYERLIVDIGYVDAAQQAEREAFDALVINSFADYGLDAMRAVLSIPVAGAGEAAIAEGARDGRRFSIVTVWPESLAHLYAERLRACAGGERCLRVRHVSPEEELAHLGAEDGVMERMHRGEAAILARLVRECEHAIAEDGASAIVLGCTCMAPIGPRLAAAVRVPVIEPSRAGFSAAVDALRARKVDAGANTRAAVRVARAGLVPAIVDAWMAAAEQHAGAQAGSSPASDTRGRTPTPTAIPAPMPMLAPTPAEAECPVCVGIDATSDRGDRGSGVADVDSGVEGTGERARGHRATDASVSSSDH